MSGGVHWPVDDTHALCGVEHPSAFTARHEAVTCPACKRGRTPAPRKVVRRPNPNRRPAR